jgi:hypothetical protein
MASFLFRQKRGFFSPIFFQRPNNQCGSVESNRITTDKTLNGIMNISEEVVPLGVSPFDAELLSDAANGLCLMSNAMKHNIEMKRSVSLQVADLENKLKDLKANLATLNSVIDLYKDKLRVQYNIFEGGRGDSQRFVEKHMFKAEKERDSFIVYHKMSCRRFSGRETDLLDVKVVSLNSFGFFPCEQCHGGILK